jgi:hypothetical protein
MKDKYKNFLRNREFLFAPIAPTNIGQTYKRCKFFANFSPLFYKKSVNKLAKCAPLPKKTDLKDLFKQVANKDETALKSAVQFFYGYTFRGKRCEQSRAISVYKSRWGEYLVKDQRPEQELSEPKNLQGIIYSHTQNLSDKDRFAEQVALLAKFGICTAGIGIAEPPAPKARARELRPVPVADANEAEQSGGFFHQTLDYIPSRALSYLKQKTGVTNEILAGYCIKGSLIKGLPGYAFLVDDWVKLKCPFAERKEDKYRSNRGAKPYVFGYKQLPAKGENLFICAGEDDTLAIASAGVSSICLGSETTTIDAALASELKARFNRVFVCYDLDKTGREWGEKMATEHGFTVADLGLYLATMEQDILTKKANPTPKPAADPGKEWEEMLRDFEILGDEAAISKYKFRETRELEAIKDICDLKAAGVDISEFVNWAFQTYSETIAIEGDLFGFSGIKCLDFNFNRYLSESSAQISIKYLLSMNPRLMLQSPAGTGKSTCIAELCKPTAQFERGFLVSGLGYERAIIAVPTTTIAEQLQKDFQGKGVNSGLLLGTTAGADRDAAAAAVIIVTTYDSLSHIETLVKNSLLIIDETHQAINDFGFRAEADRVIFRFLQDKEQAILGLSATPNLFFCSGLVDYFDLKLVRFFPKNTNRISVKVLEYNKNAKHQINEVLAGYERGLGSLFLKIDSKATIKIFAEKAGDLSLNCLELNAQKKESAEYSQIVENGRPDIIPDILASTKLLEAGVSLKFPIQKVVLFDVSEWDSLIQTATRPRMYEAGGITYNSLVRVDALMKPKAQQDGDKRTVSERFLAMLKGGNDLVGVLNANKAVLSELKLKGGGGLATEREYFYIEDGAAKPDVLRILYALKCMETALTPIEILKKRVMQFDPRFSFETNEDLGEIAKDEDLAAAAKAAIFEQDLAFDAVLEQIKANPEFAVRAIISGSKNADLNEQARAAFGIPKVGTDEYFDYKTQTAEIFAANSQNGRLLSLLIKVAADQKTSAAGAAGLIQVHGANELNGYLQEKELKANLIKYRKNEELPTEFLVECCKAAAARKVVTQTMKDANAGKRSNAFTAADLAKIVQRGMKEAKLPNGAKLPVSCFIGEKGIINYLSQFYKIARSKQAGTRKNIYVLQGIKLLETPTELPPKKP